MIKVLAIGNSFSEDATYYLHRIADADGVELKAVNLYIGGCTLERHRNNIVADAEEYIYEENGENTGRRVSVKQALEADKWDYIVTQQASHDSGIEQSYFPYLEQIAQYVKERAPQAELLLQQTWAYDTDCLHDGFRKYGNDQKIMYDALCKAYKKAARQIGVRLIPCGDAVQLLRTKLPFNYGHGGMSVCRDGFHMNVIYGRYLLAAVWYGIITGNSVARNTYVPYTDLAPNAICDEEVLNVVKTVADEITRRQDPGRRAGSI